MRRCSSKGISLISLIITIIVIIILAAIVIFSGMGTPEKAQLSAVISDIDNVQTAVDQAYYGLYTEKSVEGEVWTKSQYYEAVATGETDRNNLSGIGIVEISNDGMVEMHLPKYEGRKWGVAVEDIDATTQVGSVVLMPGFTSEQKIYSTLLDTQTGGRDSQLTEIMNSDIKVKNVKITTDMSGTILAGNEISEGTKLYISFDVTQNKSAVTVEPSIPYEATENGEYIFNLKDTEGRTKKRKVYVNNYKIPKISSFLEVGDYVEYNADADNIYVIDPDKTGTTQNALEFKPETCSWRVWKKNSDGSIIIMPTAPVNKLFLNGVKGFTNSIEILEGVCDLYTNKALGVTANDIRSLKVEDLEDTRVSPNLVALKNDYQKNHASYPQYGQTHTTYYGDKYTSGNYYTATDGVTIRKNPNVASNENPVDLKQTFYMTFDVTWNKLNEDKFASETYGTLLSANHGWLASACTGVFRDYAAFGLRGALSNGVGAYLLCRSDIYEANLGYGVRPLVTLNSSLQVDRTDLSNDGSSADKAWKIVKK